MTTGARSAKNQSEFLPLAITFNLLKAREKWLVLDPIGFVGLLIGLKFKRIIERGNRSSVIIFERTFLKPFENCFIKLSCS